MTATVGLRLEDTLPTRGLSHLLLLSRPRQLAAVASAAGFNAAAHAHATLADVRRLLAAGHPILAPLDVTPAGDPGANGGESAHYAVLVGLAPNPGGGGDENPLVLARHSWNLRALHAWPWADLEASSRQLAGTSFYGGPRDAGVPPSVYTQGARGLKRPARCRLGAVAGQPRASSIAASLAGTFVEVVPRGVALVGTHEVSERKAGRQGPTRVSPFP